MSTSGRQPDGMPVIDGRRLFGVYLAAAMVVAIVFYQTFFGERITTNQGYGWDGVRFYGPFAEAPERILTTDRYHFRRALPSVIVHYALRVVGLATSRPYVISGFATLNFVVLVAAVWAWCDLARRLSLTAWAAHLGLVALFVNYHVLKFMPFNPVMTDAAAYGMGIGIIWAWHTRNSLILFILAILGAYTHPLLFPMAGILFCFPRHECHSSLGTVSSDAEVRPERRTILIAVFTSLGIFLILVAAVVVDARLEETWPLSSVRHTVFLFSGIAISASYMGWLLVSVWPSFGVFFRWMRMTSPRSLFFRLAILGVSYAFIEWSVPHTTSDYQMTAVTFLKRVVLLSWKSRFGEPLPGVFLVAHGVVLGPVFLAALTRLPDLFRVAAAQGMGLFLLTTGTALFVLYPETRASAPILASLLTVVAMRVDALNGERLQGSSPRVLAVVLTYGVALLASRFWIGFLQEDGGIRPGVLFNGGWFNMQMWTYCLVWSAMSYLLWVTVIRAANARVGTAGDGASSKDIEK